MEKIILRHLSGSKKDQVDEIQTDAMPEVVLGRDPEAQVSYDAQRDDLVSRQHARIARDPADATRWVLHDLGSRNGTFLNKQRVSGQAVLSPGDVVQFGPGGPEFQFDLDPRPTLDDATREVNAPVAPPATRESSIPAAVSGAGSTPGGSGQNLNTPAPFTTPTPPAPAGVGKATLEREITRAKSESRSSMLWAGAGLAFAAALLIGFLAWSNRGSEQALESKLAKTEKSLKETKKGLEDERSSRYMTAAQVAKLNTPGVVFISASWKLVEPSSGGFVYHQYVPVRLKGGVRRVPAYLLNANGSYEPALTLESAGNKVIGGGGTGSGFVVTDDGFILTNRHVAASWFSPMALPPGVVVRRNDKKIVGTVESGPRGWVPADALDPDGRYSLSGRTLVGRNDYLEVTFPGEKSGTEARLIKVSDEHDVALMKIDPTGSLKALELNPESEEAQAGKPIVVIGYPLATDLAPGVAAVRDVSGSGRTKLKFVPEPTVTPGSITRVISVGDNTKYVNLAGDVYQHSAGTNPGNSGGPVCDHRGRVIGVHFAGRKDVQAGNFAVPIKYAIKLLGEDKVKISSGDDDDAKADDAEKESADDDVKGDAKSDSKKDGDKANSKKEEAAE